MHPAWSTHISLWRFWLVVTFPISCWLITTTIGCLTLTQLASSCGPNPHVVTQAGQLVGEISAAIHCGDWSPYGADADESTHHWVKHKKYQRDHIKHILYSSSETKQPEKSPVWQVVKKYIGNQNWTLHWSIGFNTLQYPVFTIIMWSIIDCYSY